MFIVMVLNFAWNFTKNALFNAEIFVQALQFHITYIEMFHYMYLFNLRKFPILRN